MNLRLKQAAAVLVCMSAWTVGRADDAAKPEATLPPRTTQQTVDKALEFLIKDAAKWRQDRGCATCHHGTMTVWALSEAKSQGYTVATDKAADMLGWTKERFIPRIDKPRDPRPGWNLVSVPGIYLGLMSQNLPVLSRAEVNTLAIHLAGHQEEDGAWLMPPPSNGSPPTWESRETIVLLALLAWEPYVPADPTAAAAARTARDKAVAWLNSNPATEATQATALRLLLDFRTGRPADQLQPRIDQLLTRQNPDGGWSPLKDLPSDAYTTGQALWALSFVGVDKNRSEIGRAVAYLQGTQKEDGSWPMTSRNHPGVDSTKQRNPVPITYFGSAWATIGLVRTVPPTLDLAARQQRAFDSIKMFSGTNEVDDKSPEKPVSKVRIVYAVDDEELGNLVQDLTAFAQLESLQFKSARMTDAGVPHLKALAQLRHLSLEDAAITDAGLAELKALTYLEELNLKGTKVTDAGVQDFQKVMPKTKVVR